MLVPERTVSNVLDRCLGVTRNEDVVILSDSETDLDVVAALRLGVEARGARCVVASMERYARPGSEPPRSIAGLLLACDAAIELTSTFIGSSQARQAASASGVRYICMPGVEVDTFRLGGPLDVDFDELRPLTEQLAAGWEQASRFRITSRGGTDIEGSVVGRKGRALHGIARTAGAYMAPPDIEAGTAPVEGSVNGVVVVDADFLFMGHGPLVEPVALHFRDGLLIGVEGPEAHRLTDMIELCSDDRMTNLAEVSVGLNPNGRVCGVAMETESTLGTAHIALGNSIAYGGTVAAVAHLDCVMKDAVLEFDGREVLHEGRLVP
ncbi:MAG: hypothetical protein WCP26_08720 [Actinomycetes bacterium]